MYLLFIWEGKWVSLPMEWDLIWLTSCQSDEPDCEWSFYLIKLLLYVDAVRWMALIDQDADQFRVFLFDREEMWSSSAATTEPAFFTSLSGRPESFLVLLLQHRSEPWGRISAGPNPNIRFQNCSYPSPESGPLPCQLPLGQKVSSVN